MCELHSQPSFLYILVPFLSSIVALMDRAHTSLHTLHNPCTEPLTVPDIDCDAYQTSLLSSRHPGNTQIGLHPGHMEIKPASLTWTKHS